MISNQQIVARVKRDCDRSLRLGDFAPMLLRALEYVDEQTICAKNGPKLASTYDPAVVREAIKLAREL